jgi:hypothetical protein
MGQLPPTFIRTSSLAAGGLLGPAFAQRLSRDTLEHRLLRREEPGLEQCVELLVRDMLGESHELGGRPCLPDRDEAQSRRAMALVPSPGAEAAPFGRKIVPWKDRWE